MTQKVVSLQIDREARESIAQAKMDASNVKTEIVMLTPELAKEFLEHNFERQRQVNKGRVKKYAADMLAGHWRVTYDALRFDEDGYLVDGQHRCLAVIESGVCLPNILVVRDLPRDAFLVLDQGQKRTAVQALVMDGHEGVTQDVVATVRALFWTPESIAKADQMTLEQLREAYVKYRTAIDFACKPYSRKKSDAIVHNTLRAPVVRAILTEQYDLEQIAEFLTALDSGVMQYNLDQSAIQLRNAFMGYQVKRRIKEYGVKQHLFLLSTAALHYYLHGRVVSQLRAANKQLFPVAGLPN